MSVNERVKMIRKNASLTMEKFGSRIGLTKVQISRIESGERNLTPMARKLICYEFGVNEQWILTGEGEMYDLSYQSDIAQIVKKRHLGPEAYYLFESFLGLSKKERSAVLKWFRDYATHCLNEIQEKENRTETRTSIMTREELHAELDRQLSIESEEDEKGIASTGA